MLTLKDILRYARLEASYGNPGVPVPRDSQPASRYRYRRPPGCDCQNPEPDEGAALVSMECPVHNLYPRPKPPAE